MQSSPERQHSTLWRHLDRQHILDLLERSKPELRHFVERDQINV